VRRMEHPRPGAALGGKDFIFEHGLDYKRRGLLPRGVLRDRACGPSNDALAKDRIQGQGVDPVDVIEGAFLF